MNIAMLFLMLSFGSPNQTINDRVTLQVTNVEFIVVIKEIQKQTGYFVDYYNDILPVVGRVTLNVKNEKVKNVLDQCLKNKPFTYEFTPTKIRIIRKDSKKTSILKQQVKLPFKTVDEQGKPV